ncbi:hypothetical protein HYU11_05015 [Candidatus Woesearchaeota archaeon]|nr:hypothetical protein [Candidatus Woesearchaeota archaeon]
MSIFTTKPTKELTNEELKSLLDGLLIEVSPHALDHLSEGQRKVFKEQELKDMLLKENARKTYLQENLRYSAYFRRPDGYRKLIIELNRNKAVIVTFADTDELPKIRLNDEK